MKVRIFKRVVSLIAEQCWLAVAAFTSLIVLALIVLKPFTVDWPQSVADACNEVILAIFGSFFSGYVFYILSVLLPKAVRMESILSISKENIRYAKDEIIGLFFDNGGPSDIMNAGSEQLIQCIAIPKENGMYLIHDLRCQQIHHSIIRVQDYLQYVITHSDYLLDRNLNQIKDIMDALRDIEVRMRERHNSLDDLKHIPETERLFENEDRRNIQTYGLEEIKSIIDTLRSLYSKIVALYLDIHG